MKTEIMRKELLVLFLGAAVVLAQGPGGRMGGPGGFGGRGAEMLGGPMVTGAPFTGTEVLTIQEKFADGNSVNTTTSSLRARDSQGRTYTGETITPAAASGKAAYTRITITDPVAGYRYELNSDTMIAVQTRMPAMRPGPSAASNSGAAVR